MKFQSHSSAIVESRCVGDGTRIWAFSHVQPRAVIGADGNVGEHCFIENGAAIGDRVTIKNGVCIWEGVVIGNDVFVGPNAAFTNDRRPRSPRSPWGARRYRDKAWLVATLVGEGATIGANATLVGPCLLGRHCFVAAGAVVLRDVKDFELVAGNPARHVGWVNEFGERVGRRPHGK
jgi:acetyltransferase-like isoleucine patch superfamily enzyme